MFPKVLMIGIIRVKQKLKAEILGRNGRSHKSSIGRRESEKLYFTICPDDSHHQGKFDKQF